MRQWLDLARSGVLGTLAGMGQQEALVTGWEKLAYVTRGDWVEILNEGDGKVLVRTAHNRDRQIRLTLDQISQLNAITTGRATEPVPAVVGK